MDIRYLSYLSFCHAIPKLRSYCDQKLKLSLKFSYKYWTHCKTLSKTIQSLYFSLIFIFQSLKLEFERLSIFQKFSESFTKYLIRTFIHFNWPVPRSSSQRKSWLELWKEWEIQKFYNQRQCVGRIMCTWVKCFGRPKDYWNYIFINSNSLLGIYVVPNYFRSSKTFYSIAHEPAINIEK